MINTEESTSQLDLSLKPYQLEILRAIRSLWLKRKRPPSMREVAAALKRKSPGGLSYQYSILESKGYLRRDPGRPRTVEVRMPGEPPFPSESSEPGQLPDELDPADEDLRPHARSEEVTWVPVVGQIAAGAPILAEPQSFESRVPLPRQVVGGDEEELFILKVHGESMTGVGINAGDWVVVRQLFQPPRNGDIVAATINGAEVEGTVKTYMKLGRDVLLLPQSPGYHPILGNKAKIDGKVIAVLRQI